MITCCDVMYPDTISENVVRRLTRTVAAASVVVRCVNDQSEHYSPRSVRSTCRPESWRPPTIDELALERAAAAPDAVLLGTAPLCGDFDWKVSLRSLTACSVISKFVAGRQRCLESLPINANASTMTNCFASSAVTWRQVYIKKLFHTGF